MKSFRQCPYIFVIILSKYSCNLIGPNSRQRNVLGVVSYSLAEDLILVRNTFYAICVYLALSDCKEVLDKFPEAKSGQYEIKLWTSGKTLTVNCDMETEGGGWTIFHRRMDGSVDFYRNFTDYENGFGNVKGELWLGLKYIQEIAGQGSTEIRLDMTSSDSRTGHETCPDFKLTEGTKYTLNIGSCSGVGIESNIFMLLFYYIFVYMYLAK
ncbi:ficolin-1-like [Ruditapes philippinarum]|uniref:ficolin-1-like n=1 Tax=Ruditapes philippinarum TaxID=129788 RepID=UPI00295C25EF|nr:ficolin-1-like [Ruditapes philippinarum]